MYTITDFQSSLLREKFEIYDPNVDRNAVKPVIALSNRMTVKLQKNEKSPAEEYVVRAQNMHLCIRFAGRMINSFNSGGSLKNRAKRYDWEGSFENILNHYERVYNENRWIAVYYHGQVIFEVGERHPLLDLIEKCDLDNNADYDYAIPLAEKALQKTGKTVKIDHDANVALVTTFENNEGRCGVILRGADRTTTFSFTTLGSEDKALNIPQCLYAAAAFLEGIQLAFLVGMNIFKVNVGIIEKNSAEHKQTKEGQRRLRQLSAEISNMDSGFTVRYRPEKPEFNMIVRDSEEQASRVIDVREALEAIQKAEEKKDQELKEEEKQAKKERQKKAEEKPTEGTSTSIFDLD